MGRSTALDWLSFVPEIKVAHQETKNPLRKLRAIDKVKGKNRCDSRLDYLLFHFSKSY